MSRSTGVRFAKNGPYYQAIWHDLSGKRKVKSLGRISEAEARRRCRELEAMHIAKPGAANVGKSPTLGAWRDRAGTVHQGTVKAMLKTGLLGVAKKGELQWGHAVDPVQATKTLEAA